MQTEDLIRTLTADLKPVRRLPPPEFRVLSWLSLSLVYLALLVALMGLRPDIQFKMRDPIFVVEVGAAFVTGLLAAAAAFCSECPGRPFWERFAPLPALALWLGTLGGGCWKTWLRAGAEGLALRPDFACFPSIVLASLIPGAMILFMIRRGAPIAPITTTALAVLGAAALATAALRLFHTEDASIMVLVWQFGSVAALTALGALAGKRVLRWPQEMRS